ncbi:MAG: delta-60 repeat domain-containing protein [Acidobacteriota bacterium]|nr:delta-60 repeat domain-containing protein [Acidobacteriota bacterium]
MLIVACAGLIFVSARAFSFETNGDLDLSFNPPKFTNGIVAASVMQPDGKLVIAGGFAKVNGVARRNIARLNADGSLDTSFDPLGGTDGTIFQLIRQSDGKFIIIGGMTDAAGGGPFGSVNGTARNNIARLNSDGSLDMSFDPGVLISFDGVISGGVATNPGLVTEAVLQSDGKIVVVGEFIAVANGATTSVSRNGIARFNSDGTFDASYNPGTGFGATATTFAPVVAKQSSDKVIVVGAFTDFNGNAVPGIVRVNTDGSYDASFSSGTGPDDPNNVYGLFVQSDDRIMVFG